MTDGNVDQREIEKFSALASRWWDLEGAFKPLHQINPLRLDYIEAYADGLFGKQIVDVGCGGGILAESMARRKAHVTGIDMAEDSLTVARLHALESGIELDYQQTTAEQFASQQAGKFDLVTCMEMLEHVPDPASVVQACAQLANQHGLVYFSTLNRNLKSWAMAILAAERLLKLVPPGTHEHDKFIKPAELVRWCEKAGLKVVHMTGLHMNPLTNSFYLSEKNVDVNYMLVCKKLADD